MAEVIWRGRGIELVVRDDNARYKAMLRDVLAAVGRAAGAEQAEPAAQLEGGAGGQFERSGYGPADEVNGRATRFGFRC